MSEKSDREEEIQEWLDIDGNMKSCLEVYPRLTEDRINNLPLLGKETVRKKVTREREWDNEVDEFNR
jgi:hypothetical protein